MSSEFDSQNPTDFFPEFYAELDREAASQKVSLLAKLQRVPVFTSDIVNARGLAAAPSSGDLSSAASSSGPSLDELREIDHLVTEYTQTYAISGDEMSEMIVVNRPRANSFGSGMTIETRSRADSIGLLRVLLLGGGHHERRNDRALDSAHVERLQKVWNDETLDDAVKEREIQKIRSHADTAMVWRNRKKG